MATCKHENQYLMGTNNGIVCRKCGALFSTFDEIYPPEPKAEKLAEAAAAEAPAEQPKPKRGGGRRKKAE